VAVVESCPSVLPILDSVKTKARPIGTCPVKTSSDLGNVNRDTRLSLMLNSLRALDPPQYHSLGPELEATQTLYVREAGGADGLRNLDGDQQDDSIGHG
jgi:hypothetical protein